MGRRVLVAIIAIIVAGAGTFFIWQWVDGYEASVEAQFDTVDVYVATAEIPEGTRATSLADVVELTSVVEENVVPGAVQDLGQLSGQVAAVDILLGEQLVAQKFVDEQAYFNEAIERAEAPPGTVEVTFTLSEERLVGGQVRPGDYVAFITSFDPFTVDTAFQEPGVEGDFTAVLPDEGATDAEDAEDTIVQTPNVTSTVVHKVFVTNLQYATPPALEDEEGNPVAQDPRQAPQSQLFVTLAAPIGDVEKMVFAREYGAIWLALEDLEDPEESSQIVTRANIFSDD